MNIRSKFVEMSDHVSKLIFYYIENYILLHYESLTDFVPKKCSSCRQWGLWQIKLDVDDNNGQIIGQNIKFPISRFRLQHSPPSQNQSPTSLLLSSNLSVPDHSLFIAWFIGQYLNPKNNLKLGWTILNLELNYGMNILRAIEIEILFLRIIILRRTAFI